MKKLLTMLAAAATMFVGCDKTPEAVRVKSVSLDKTTLTLEIGASATLTATVTPADADDKSVAWSTSDAATATVDNAGKVTAVKAGNATITVTTKDGAKTATCAVTVNAAPAPVISITTQPTAPEGELTEGAIPADTKLTVVATLNDIEDVPLVYQWYTYDPAQQGDAKFTKIDGATAATYTLPTDIKAGDHWYVCEVSATGATAKQTDPVKITVKAPATRYPITGKAGTLDWSLAESGTMTISGAGDMPDYLKPSAAAKTRAATEPAPWAAYANEIEIVVIKTGVTSIGTNAFAALPVLEQVIIETSVTAIGDGAFAECAALTTVTLPETLKSIGDGAFEGCSALEEITVPAGTEIGDGAFPPTTEVTTPTTPTTPPGGGGGGGGVTPPPAFVAVTGITGVPTTATKGVQLALTGTVAPADATNKTIVWSVKSAGTTGAIITGNKFDASETGKATITATITNGLTASTPYTEDFDITVGLPPLVTPAAITGATAPRIGWTLGDGGNLTAGNDTFGARITGWDGASPSDKPAYNTVYTAIVELTQKTGYTFEGGFADLASIAAFTVNGNAPTAFVNNNKTTLTYKVAFPATPTLVTAAAIEGVTSPAAGATPSTAITNGTGFTAALTWKDTPALADGKFDYQCAYVARITLTATTGYTFAGNYGDTAAIAGFTVNGIAPTWVSRSDTELVFDVTFPATAAKTLVTAAAMTGATAPVAHETPTTGALTVTGSTQFTAEITEWKGTMDASGKFKHGESYKAVVKLTAATGYTFDTGASEFANATAIADFKVNTIAPTTWKSNDGATLIFEVAFPETLAEDNINYVPW